MNSKPELTLKLILTISIICLGSFQFGYHMSELNSPEAILSCHVSVPGKISYSNTWFGQHGLKQCIPLDTKLIGLITSIFSIGGLVGSLYVGNFSERWGRKKAILLHCVFYTIGSTLNGISNSYYMLLVGRFTAGIGAGMAIVLTSLYINEISPPDYKGFLGSMNQVSINCGILSTQLLALKWCNDNNWRLLLFTGAFLSITTFILALLYVDESPMWLLNNGKPGKAFEVLHKLRGGEYINARNEVNSWKGLNAESDHLLNEEGEDLVHNRSVNLETYLKSPEYYNSKLVATGILVLQQFSGVNSIIFYGVSVLVTLFPTHAIGINCLISVVNAVVTFSSAPLVDRLGRKPLLLTSVSVMGFAVSLMAIGIISSSPIICIVGTFTYITFFAIGLGPIPFLLVGEVTQPEAKASAQSWGTTMNWLATFVVGFLFPILKNSWIGNGVYFIFALMCFFSFGFIKMYIPETKGTTSYEQVWGDARLD